MVWVLKRLQAVVLRGPKLGRLCTDSIAGTTEEV